jgi:hypothetical protein
MTWLLGTLAWLLALWGAWSALRLFRVAWGQTDTNHPTVVGAVWMLGLAVAAVFLSRPEEEVTAGEDPAAYLHTAAAFARHSSLTFQDPALARLSRDDRLLFRYGHHGFGYTKDACLWVKNADTAEVGSWFQPAFALLLSVPVALFSPWAAFAVPPLFALLSALMIAGLVLRGARSHGIALAACALFLAHPAMAWNARCLRPEIPALFFTLLGVTGLLDSQNRERHGFVGGALTGLALTVAALFHMTAVYVLLPALWMAAALHGRSARGGGPPQCVGACVPLRYWRGWWLGTALGVALMTLQTALITDPYSILPNLRDPARARFALGAFALYAGIAGLLRFAPAAMLRARPVAHLGRIVSGRACGALAATGFGAAALWIYRFRTELGDVPGLPAWATAYLSLTDFRGIVRLSSRLWSLAALAGLYALLCAKPRAQRATGRRLFLLLAPASLTVGWMFHYMFETRRTLTALLPLMVLALAAALNTVRITGLAFLRRERIRAFLRLPPGAAWPSAVLTGLLALGLIAVAVRGRSLLYRLRNHSGTYAYYRDLSRELADAGDFLLAEYTQTAAPAASFSGLPLLPVAWGYRTDREYRQAEKVWRQQALAHPQRRHLLLLPFSGTALPGLALEPLFERRLATRALARTRGSIPAAAHERVLHLRAFRVLAHPESPQAKPFTRVMDGSRLGLAGGAIFLPQRPMDWHGIPLAPHRPLTLPHRFARLTPRQARPAETGAVNEELANALAGAVLLVLAVPDSRVPASVALRAGERNLPVRRITLCPGWEALEIDSAVLAAEPEPLHLHVSEKAYLTQMMFLPAASGRARSLALPQPPEPGPPLTADTQWLRAEAALALPFPAAPSRLWLLASTERDDRVTGVLTLHPRAPGAASREIPLGAGWRWHVVAWPAFANADGTAQWLDLRVDPAWNPQQRGFPNDLGVRLHAVVLQPGETP